MRPTRLTTLLVGLAALAAGCGDGDSGDAASQAPTTATAPSNQSTATTAGGLPPTTPFTFAPRDTSAFVAGEGTLTLAGDLQGTARFSSTSCAGITVTEPRGVSASLLFVPEGAGGSRRYVLDLAGMSPGNTTFPEPGGLNQTPPRRVRLVAESPGEVLTWGTTAAGTGTVSGTLMTRVANARSGSFTLQLGFAGSENGGVPSSARGPVTVTGSWTCP